MHKENCEEILIALMAVFDGEQTDFSPEQLNAHTAECESCRREIEEMQGAFSLLREQSRNEFNANLWPSIDARIDAGAKTRWTPFLFVGALLVGYKFLEMIPETAFGFVFKIVPVALVVALFVLLKENPFKINTELILEK
jgi:Putative zinc-finger